MDLQPLALGVEGDLLDTGEAMAEPDSWAVAEAEPQDTLHLKPGGPVVPEP